jgi:NAD(P)-dependent dehydrogenase (short-subunit alcohol dehydrogenase family)
MNENEWNGRVCLVTGAASGIGRAAAFAFAQAGARVVAADMNMEGGEETVAMLRSAGGDAIFRHVDVTREADVGALMNTAIAHFGRLDCAFNNVGITGPMAAVDDYAEDDWDRVLSVNLKSIWLCVKHEIRQMRKQGHGAIVNSSSILGLRATRNFPAYVASKHGVIGLTRAAALECAGSGIRINAICPGYINTPMMGNAPSQQDPARERPANDPAVCIGQPEQIARTVLWLCSDAASFIHGDAIVADGGSTLPVASM